VIHVVVPALEVHVELVRTFDIAFDDHREK
jgi:hypothetical protein